MTVWVCMALGYQLGFGVTTAPAPDEAPTDEATQSDEERQQDAVDAFYRGDALFKEAKYAEALAAFEEADRLHPAADLQYNIGLCHMRLSHWRDAIIHFEVYLRTKEDPTDRADVEHRIQRARNEIENAEALARLKAEREAAEREAAEPGPVREQPVEPLDDRPAVSKPHRGLVIVGSAFVGLGVSAAIAGVTGFGVVIRDKNDDLDKIVNEGNPEGVSYGEASQVSDEAQRMRTAMWITVGAASAVAVVGASLLAVGLTRRSRRNKRGLSLLPFGGPASGGFALRGRY